MDSFDHKSEFAKYLKNFRTVFFQYKDEKENSKKQIAIIIVYYRAMDYGYITFDYSFF